MPKANNGPRLKANERGIYEIHWTEAGRSRRSSTRTSDYESAKKVLAAFLTLGDREARLEERGPLLVMDVLGDPDLPEGADYWHEHVLVKVISQETALFAVKKLRQHFGHLAVVDIMPDDVDEYVEARKEGRIGRPSINHTITRELSVLTAAINHAVKKKRLPRADAPFIQTPGVSPPRDRWLEYGEAESLIAAAAEPVDPRLKKGDLPRIYIFIMTALEAASRKRAVETLQRRQIDLARGLIYLNPPGRAQTKKRRPVVKISSRLRPVIEQALMQIPDDPKAYLLGHPGSIRTAFEGAVVRAGLGRFDERGNCVTDVTPHVLRHTKATWCAQAGVDLWKIANLLGDTLATVERVYAHHHPDYQKDAVEVGPGSPPKLRVVA